MTANQRDELSQFEKNRFFEGKLMTARDMEIEQAYHTERLHTLARATAGKGIVSGLSISDVSAAGDRLEVTIEPGLAIDGNGRPVVVEHTTTKSLPAPSGGEIYLSLRYSEAAIESVPVPEAGDDEEYTPNRTVEVFELTYQEHAPAERTGPPEVEIPVEDDPDPAAIDAAIRASFETGQGEDPSVFVGAFERTPDGSWRAHDDDVRRPLVYETELVYGALLAHVTDTDNPHGTSTDDARPDEIEDMAELETVQEQLTHLQTELDAVRERNERLDRYAMGKALTSTGRLFETVADRFEAHSPSGSKTAREIATSARDGYQAGAHEAADQYRQCVRSLLSVAVQLGDQLDGTAREADLDEYVAAVSELQSVLERVGPTHELAIALDELAETAAAMDATYAVHSTE